MRINLKPISKPSNFFVISFFISIQTFAFSLPIGLNEGLMGNAGSAISETTAPSFYNPGLLTEKKINSVVLGGNTLSNFSSQSKLGNANSTALSPTYVSSIQSFENFVHEFFLANVSSFNFRSVQDLPTGKTDLNFKFDSYYMGYTFGFHQLPVGFQVMGRYSEAQMMGDYEYNGVGASANGTLRSSSKRFEALLGIGAIHDFGKYRFGYRYISRGFHLLDQQDGLTKIFTYSSVGNTYSKSELPGSISTEKIGEILWIGHSFRSGDHEFLTDTKFEELGDLSHTYNWTQTFGYQVRFDSGYRIMTGVGHMIHKDITYFGQSAYYSVGFSWIKNTYRSAVGLYHIAQKINDDTRVVGVTFNSEFIY